jgi:hypothetical protein
MPGVQQSASPTADRSAHSLLLLLMGARLLPIELTFPDIGDKREVEQSIASIDYMR